MRELPGLIHILTHFRITREVLINIARGLSPADTEILRETERAHSVYQAEIDHFRHPALIRRNRVRCDTENF